MQLLRLRFLHLAAAVLPIVLIAPMDALAQNCTGLSRIADSAIHDYPVFGQFFERNLRRAIFYAGPVWRAFRSPSSPFARSSPSAHAQPSITTLSTIVVRTANTALNACPFTIRWPTRLRSKSSVRVVLP
jgi:hypothetical protein